MWKKVKITAPYYTLTVQSSERLTCRRGIVSSNPCQPPEDCHHYPLRPVSKTRGCPPPKRWGVLPAACGQGHQRLWVWGSLGLGGQHSHLKQDPRGRSCKPNRRTGSSSTAKSVCGTSQICSGRFRRTLLSFQQSPLSGVAIPARQATYTVRWPRFQPM
jgi:hypothetical protein